MNKRLLIGYLYCVLMAIWVSPLWADDKVCLAESETTSNTLNINTANADELSSKLKGVGKAKAAAIIQWRETNGKFTSLEDVDEVKGIGPALLEKNKAVIRFED
jgi:competence protein ComEA